MGDGTVKIMLGNTVHGPKVSESYQTLNYNFKPSSVKNQHGILWKEKDSSGKSKKVVLQYSQNSSEGGGEASGQSSHSFEGILDTGGAYDYVLIVGADGEARLEKLAGNAKMGKLKGSKDLPIAKPPPLPEPVKRKYNIPSTGTPPRPQKAGKSVGGLSPSEDDSDSDSDIETEAPQASAPAQPSGGGKGLMLGGKGLLTKDMMPTQQQQPSSDSDESESEDEESESD